MMINRIMRRLLPKALYDNFDKHFFVRNISRKIEEIRNLSGSCIIFISTPIHGNLGDQAIVYAQEQFFCDRGLEKNILEITYPQYQRYLDIIKEKISKDDLIVIDGGGNMGTLWLEVEHKMQNIVREFSNNPVVIFPQTIFYSDDDDGRRELQQSIKAYSSHKNLYICAREKSSYMFMKKVYLSNNILLVPDIVLYLSNIFNNSLRKGAILCLRSDKEKLTSNDQVEYIKKELSNRELEIKYESTLIYKVVTKRNRAKVLRKKLYAFSQAKIVITDRLHGMVFAAITGTPCIALDNSSRKVSNVYEWIKDLNYVHFLDENDENIAQHIDHLLSIGCGEYNNKELLPYYDELFDIIEQNIKH